MPKGGDCIFFAENENYRGETIEREEFSRKLKADMFIDDRNLGGATRLGGCDLQCYKDNGRWGGNALQVMAGNSSMPAPKKRKWWSF